MLWRNQDKRVINPRGIHQQHAFNRKTHKILARKANFWNCRKTWSRFQSKEPQKNESFGHFGRKIHLAKNARIKKLHEKKIFNSPLKNTDRPRFGFNLSSPNSFRASQLMICGSEWLKASLWEGLANEDLRSMQDVRHCCVSRWRIFLTQFIFQCLKTREKKTLQG